MKITPLEIRQKTFEKKLRGYDKEEVDAYLSSLSQEWERLQTENKEQQIRVESLNQDVQKLREVESSLFRTLKTAEDTSAGMVDQAKTKAELHLRDAHMQAEGLINEAKKQARDMLDDAEEVVKESLHSVKDQVKQIELEYQQIENQKEHLLMELKTLANETMERVEKSNARYKGFQQVRVPSADEVIGEANTFEAPRLKEDYSQSENVEEEKPNEIRFEIESPKPEPVIEEPVIEEPKDDREEESDKGGSFFDQV